MAASELESFEMEARRPSLAAEKRKSISEEAARSFMVQQASSTSSGLSELEVMMSLVTAIIGAGVVALPSLMQLAGWVLGPAICVFTGICFMVVGVFMHEALCVVDSQGERSVRVQSFEDFGQAALGGIGVKMVQTTVTGMFFGYLVAYSVLIGKNVRILLPMAVCSKPKAIWCILGVSPILAGFGMLKDMKLLAKLMPLGLFFSVAGCLLICYKGVADASMRNDTWRDDEAWTAEEPLYNVWPESGSALGTVIAVLFASFAVMGTVPTIRGSMKDTSEFPSAFRKAISLCLVLYLCVMVCAYYGYGNFIKDSIVASMRQFPDGLDEARDSIRDGESDFTGKESPVIGNAMALMVTCNLIISYPVYFQCVIKSIGRISPEASYAQYGTPANRILRVIMVAVTTGIAMLVPFFRSLLAILASVFASCNNVLFPLLFSYKVFGRSNALPNLSATMKVFHAFLVLFACICAVLGLIDSVTGLITKLNAPAPEDKCGTLR